MKKKGEGGKRKHENEREKGGMEKSEEEKGKGEKVRKGKWGERGEGEGKRGEESGPAPIISSDSEFRFPCFFFRVLWSAVWK